MLQKRGEGALKTSNFKRVVRREEGENGKLQECVLAGVLFTQLLPGNSTQDSSPSRGGPWCVFRLFLIEIFAAGQRSKPVRCWFHSLVSNGLLHFTGKHIQCRTEIMPDANLKAIYQAQFWRLLPFGSLQIYRCPPRLSTRLHCLCNLLLQEWRGETFEHLKTFEDCCNVAYMENFHPEMFFILFKSTKKEKIASLTFLIHFLCPFIWC